MALGASRLFLQTNSRPNIARLGWAASGGLMLSASVFNLIYPGLEDGGIIPVAIGIALGVILMVVTSIWLENKDFEFEGLSKKESRKIDPGTGHPFHPQLPGGYCHRRGIRLREQEQLGILIAIAIAIHNIPEGLAVALPWLQKASPAGALCSGQSSPASPRFWPLSRLILQCGPSGPCCRMHLDLPLALCSYW